MSAGAASGADPVAEEALLARLVARTTAALGDLVRPDGTLGDPLDGDSPADHYGATFAALALGCATEPDPRWRTLIDAFAALPPARRGHAPFNRFALLLLRDRLQRRGAMDEADRLRLADALQHCRTAARYPSNNWVLLAAACAVLEAPAGRPRRSSAARLARLSQRWFTPAGGFIDSPAAPADRPVSTPLCYHAKALAVLRLVEGAVPQAVPAGVLARGLAWLLAQTDGRGQCGGFGRSSHALFGSACMLALFLDGQRTAADEAARRGWALGARRLRLLLEAARRPDGLLGLTPHGATGEAGGWDEYMHLSVYNAWFAGLLGWWLSRAPAADEPPLPAPDFAPLGGVPEVRALDGRAGLLAVRGPRGAGWLSLAGQPAQGATSRTADLRWGGALPYHLVLEGQPVIAPPVRVAPARLAAEPSLAGWTPLIASGGRLWASQRFANCDVHADGPRVLLVARGAPTAVAPSPAPRGSREWLIESVDHALLGDRRRRGLGERPDALAGATATVAFLLDALEGWCAALLLLDGARCPARLLNPHGRALLPAGRALPLRLASWRLQDAPPAAVGGQLATEAAVARRVALPCSLPDGEGACGEPLEWPAHDLLLVTLLGPAGASPTDPLPLRVEAEDRRVVTSWASIALR